MRTSAGRLMPDQGGPPKTAAPPPTRTRAPVGTALQIPVKPSVGAWLPVRFCYRVALPAKHFGAALNRGRRGLGSWEA